MSEIDNEQKVLKHSISELNEKIEKRSVNFSVEPSDTKPFDIYLMTGNHEDIKGSDKK